MVRARGERLDSGAEHHLALGEITLAEALGPLLALADQVTAATEVRVSLFTRDAQHVVAHSGPAEDVPARLPRGSTPCELVLAHDQPVVVGDVADHPGLEPRGYSYVGVPVLGADGSTVGTLCGLGAVGAPVSSAELGRWQGLAAAVADRLELLLLRDDQRTPRVGSPRVVVPREVADGLAAGQFVPWYQPIVDLGTGRRVGVEALARWDHPQRGTVTPFEFVAVAERSDLVVDLDLEIWRQALAALAVARRTDPGLRLSLNFSARHTQVARCPARLSDLASAAGVPADAVDVEVTETTRLAADDDGRSTLADLRERGFRVLLDDFGTGWSTVESLLAMPHDGIKIDRSLTARMASPAGRAVLRAIAATAARQGVETVAEGVETATEAETAAELGFDHGQGYFWGRPAPTISRV
ncbi:hypothetical protein GCM10027047_25770 [Rhodococcus aerolatus]